MSNEQQLLLRHSLWQQPNTQLLCGHQSLDPEFAGVLRQHQVSVLSWDLSTQQSFQNQHIDCQHGVPDPQALTADTILLMWPKSKALALALLDCIATMPNSAQQVLAVAANDAGGKSIGSAAQKAGHSAENRQRPALQPVAYSADSTTRI